MTTSTAKYVLNATTGNTLLDLRLSTGYLSLNGQTATVVGSTVADAVYASKGTSVDFSSNTSGTDALYLDGVLADYAIDTTSSPGKVILTRTDDPSSVYTVGNTNASASVVFANGSIAVDLLTNTTVVGNLNSAVTSLADPTVASDRAQTEQVQLGNSGVLTATSLMGKLVVRGSAGVDEVFVKAGAQVDATQIGGSNDVIWLTGKWSDYTKTATGNTLTLTRTIDGKVESVNVIAGSTVTDDKLMFADGYIYTKTALTKGAGVANAAKTLSDAGGIMSHKAGEFTDVSNLGASLSATLQLITDGGLVDADYITNDATQTIKGSYTGTLEVGDKIQIAINGGTPQDVLVDRATKTFTYAANFGSTDGVNSIQLSILPANGVTLPADRRHEITLAAGGTVTLDTDNPSGTLSFFAAGDSTLNSAEAGNAALTDISLKVVLNPDVKVDDVIQLQDSAVNVGTPYTVTAADIVAGYASVKLPKNVLTGVADATHTVQAVLTDAAGNTSTTATVSITVDTDRPQASFAVSATDAAGAAVAIGVSPDATLNGSETSVLFAVSYNPSSHPLKAGDTIDIINNVTKAVIQTHLVTQTEINTAVAADSVAPKLYLSVNKSAIAGAVAVDGTYNLAITTSDAAGNTYTDAVLAPIVVDSVGVAASLTVSTVDTDGATRLPTAAEHATNDQYLAADETDVVVKVDSNGFGTGTVMKAGDVITLKVWDAAASNGSGGTGAFVALPNPGSYTHTVTAAEATAGVAYIKVDAADLASGTNTLTAELKDVAGNATNSVNSLAITKAGTVTLALTPNITDLDVTSQIVLTANQTLSKALSGTITFKHTGFNGTGFDGQTVGNDLTVDVSDSRYVNIVSGRVVITPPFDFDFTSNYDITVTAGAFETAGDLANGIPASATAAVGAATLTFSTVGVGADQASALSSHIMSVDGGGVVTLGASKKWFAVTDASTSDVSGGDYAVVLKDTNTAGSVPDANDGVSTNLVGATVQNFAAGDLIYVDDQKNDKTQINNSKFTQIANYGVGGDQIVAFDSLDGFYGGTELTLTGAGTTDVDSLALRAQLNISNSKTPTPTPITHIQRVDASGNTAIDSADQYGLGISDAQPLRIKISAPDLKAGDKIQLSYQNTDGTTATIGGQYTATDTDAANHYVTLSLSKTQLTDAANKFNLEGYNKVWASITNTQGAVSTSTLLGDDVDGGGNGFYLDLLATKPTINTLSLADATLTSAETSVDLVVAKDKIKIGDTLTLKLGSTVLATKVIDATNISNDVTFTVNKSALALGTNSVTLTNTDAQGNSDFITQAITRSDFVTYSGTVGLGPVLATANDLQVTAYDKNGNVLSTSTVATDGTYTLSIDKTQAGAVTLRVANKTAATTTADYRDEASGAAKDIGAGASIAAITVANGANQTVHITALTDLVARHLTTSTSNTVAASDANIAKYNLALTQAFVNTAATDATTQGITSILPTFTVTNTGTATSDLATNTYGQILAQISKQAVVNSKTMDEVQTLISNAITWNDTNATITSTSDIAKQVVLLGKVAQAVALATGANAASVLAAADITSYLDPAGTGALSLLSADRKADLMARIVAIDNAAAGTLDERTELVALTNKVVALAKIQDYAANSANPAPTVADFTAAGVTGVTADNLTAVNTKLVGSSAATGTVPVDGIIALVVAAGIAAQTAAVTAIAEYALDDTKPAPSVSTYALAGVTGVTTDNLAAINKKITTTTDLNAPKTVPTITLSDIQTEVTEGIGSFSAALTKIRAYIIDSTNEVTNPSPVASTYSDVGLDLINTPEEIANANYYLSKVLVNENALPANGAYLNDASLRAKLIAQNTAIAKIDAYAVDAGSTAPTPTFSDYQDAGLTISNANVSALNNAVKGKVFTAVDTASELAGIYSGLFAGVPSITSITLAGVGTVPSNGGAVANDSYLNNAELTQAGQAVKFTVNFDRGVSGVALANFGLTDSSGAALTVSSGALPSIASVVKADTEGKVWTVTVSGVSALTSGSLRLNLTNNTGISDVANPGTALSQSTYAATNFYTVDKTNTVVLEDGANQGQLVVDQAVVLTSAAADNTFTVHVKPDNLRTGDVLTFSKTVGGITSTLGAVTVASGDLSTGVTYTLNKSDMGSGGTVTVTSTDVAGNTATSFVTVTVNQYVTLQGTIGLSSKLLAATDLTVEAFDNNGNLLGTGTIDKTFSTYKLDVLKGTSGLVKLKVRSSGSGVNDYYNEGKNANGDLGAGESVSATINIPVGDTATVKTANITLLTDLAARIIAREYPSGANSAQVTAVNTAITKLLLKLSTDDVAKVYDPITSVEPDFAVSSAGVDNAAATRYGNLLTQLSQQANDKGSSLGVMLDNMASGISWNGTTSVATLNTAFAKEVVLLAKTQMAAALTTAPANIDAILSFQDLIDGGVTGLSGLTSNAGKATARKADLINRIIATNDNGDAADAMVEIQALANKAVAIAKIQDYADLTAPTASQTPIVTDYSDAGVTGVTTDNLAAVNKVVLNSSSSAIDDSTRQDLVDSGVALYTAAINTIKAYAGGGATAPTVDNYLDAGVPIVTSNNLSAINYQVKLAGVATAADTTSEIQALAQKGDVNFTTAMTQIKNYITDITSVTGVPNAATYRDAGLPTIDTAGEIESANQYLDQIMSGSPSNASIISALSAQQAALLYINEYAANNTSHAGVAPTAAQYIAAGIPSATNANIDVLNGLVDTAVVGATTTPADLSTFAKLKALVDGVFATSPTLTSITRDGTSIVNGAYQTDSVLNKAELGGTLKFKLTFNRAVTGVDTLANFATNFALVDSGGNEVTGFTLNPSITTADGGITWSVSVSGLSTYTGAELGLKLKNNAGIVDAINNNSLSTTSLAGDRYTIDTTFNEGTGTLATKIGQDLTLDGGETSVDLFVDASKLKLGDTLNVFLGAGTTPLLATPYIVTASDVLNGANINLLKSALSAGDNSITLKHYDQAGNVGVQTGTIKVNTAVTYTGVAGLGPVTAGADLLVSAYDKTGKLLSTADVTAATGRYSLTIDSTYTGPLLLRLSSKTASGTADYIDEATNQATDLGAYTISAVVNATGVGQTVNITTVTDLAAKLLTTSDGMISSDLVSDVNAAAKVTQVNTLVTKQFIDSTSNTVITAIDPQFTVGNTAGGAALTTANRYGQVLAQLSDIADQSGQNLAYVQGRVAADLGYTYSAGGGTLTAGSLAKDVAFLAKVAQAAMLTSVDTNVLSAADVTTYGGITGFASLSATRKDDVVKRIVDGAADGSATDNIAEITALVAKVNAIGIIQDYRAGMLTSTTSSSAAPTLETYLTAGFSTVTADKVGAVNKAVLGAASADMASIPDATITTAINTGVSAQTTAQNFLVNYAKGGSGTIPTVQDYVDAGISNVNATNLLAVNAKVFAIDNTTADATVKATLQTVVDTGVIANAAAVTVIRNYLASPTTAAVPTLSNYIDANLDGGVITTAAQVTNANYLLSKVLSSSISDATLGAKLIAQVTAFNTLNTYAVSGGTAPALSVYQDAGFSTQVTSGNLAEINERVNAFAANTMASTTDLLTVIKAIDLVAGATAGTQLGIQSATTAATMFTATAATATNVFSTVNASYAGDSDIKSITINITGSIDTTNDKIIFGPDSGTKITRTLNTTAGSDADVTIGTVTGVSWSYSSDYSGSTGTANLVFTKTDGTAFTAAQAQTIEKNLQFKTAGSTTVQGNRVFTLKHTDTADVASSTGASTVAVDTVTDAVDLDGATAGTQATNTATQYVNAAQAFSGKALVSTTVATPTATDIKQLSIVMGGANFDGNNAKLVLDAEKFLSGDFSSSGVSIGGITGLSYSYTASSKTLLISKTDGSNFTTPGNIPSILGGIKFETTSAVQGNRTATISYIDAGGNVGTSATSTLTVDTAISTPTVRVTTDDGTSATDKITTGGLTLGGIDADSKYQVSLDSGTTWTTAASADVNGAATLTSATTGLSALGTAGAKTVLVKATDAAGNTATTSYGFTVASAITKTATITSATDAVSTNGSTITSVASGTTTDATATTLSGSVTALAAGEQVAIYDGTTRLGYSTATTGATSWTYALTGLSTGVHSFTARVENTSATVGAAGVAGTASAAYTLNVNPSLNIATYVGINVADDVGLKQFSVAKARYIMLRRDATTEANFDFAEVRIWSNGQNIALSSYNPKVSVTASNQFNASTLASAVDGSNGTTGAVTGNFNMAAGANAWVQVDLGAEYDIAAVDLVPRVSDADLSARMRNVNVFYSKNDMSAGAAITTAATAPTDSAVYWGATSGTASTLPQSLGVMATPTIDDTTPTFSGTLSVPLGTGEELAIYTGTTRLAGTATITGTNWTFTPTTPLAAGTYTFKAMVHATTDTTGVAGRVVSNTTASITIGTTAITNTPVITNLVDNVTNNETITPSAVNTTTTDDTTPTLNGTVPSALGSNEAVAIYNGSTRVGYATTTGTNWNFTPTTALAAGQYTFTARVENTQTGVQGPVSTGTLKVNIDTTLGMTITDNVGTSKGNLTTATTTDDNVLDFTGTLDVALGTNEVVNIYDGTTKIGNATVASTGAGAGRTWSYTSSTLTDGAHTFRAVVQDSASTVYTTGRVVDTSNAITVNTAAITATASINSSTGVTDNVAINASTTGQVAANTSTDDTTPALSGTLVGSLGTNQSVAVYDTVGGVTTRLGYATVSGATWSFTPTVSAGAHSFTVAVENTISGQQGSSSAAYAVNVNTNITMDISDDAGAIKGTLTPTTYTSGNLDIYGVTVATNTGLTDIKDIPLEFLTFKGLGMAPISGGNKFDINLKTLTYYPGIAPVYTATTATFWVTGAADGSPFGIQVVLTLSSGNLSASVVQARWDNTYVGNYASMTSWAIQLLASTSSANGYGVTALTLKVLSTDDTTPTLSGTLDAPLGTGDVLAVWSMNNGVNTKLGNATVTGTTWTYTPTTALTSGDYTFKAIVQGASDTFTTGRVVSATTNTVVINNALSSPSTGVTIASLIDNDGGTGGTTSLGTVGTPTTNALTSGLSNGFSTDDATPNLTGNIGRALSTGESLVLYDTYNGVTTKVGSTTAASGLTTITTSGSGASTTWTFNPAASVGAGQHKYYAVVENALGVQGTPTGDYLVNVYDATSRAAMSINYVDNVAGSAATTTGTISLAATSYTDDSRPSFSGNLPSSFALGVNEELALYKKVGSTYTLVGRSGASTLSITGTAWSVAESAATDLVAGQDTTYVLMVQTTGSTTATAGKVVSASSASLIYSTTAPTQTTTIVSTADNAAGTGLASTQTTDTFANDAVTGLPISVSTDDTTPTLAGTISSALYAGQNLVVYDTVNGVTTKVAGTVTGLTAGTGTAIGSGTSWTFTPTSPLSAGKHSFTARVESGTGEFAAFSTDAREVNVHTGLTMNLADDVGKAKTVSGATGMTTDDNLPTMSGTLTAGLGANEELAVYSSLGGAAYVKVAGVATVTGTNWTFTPSATLADGSYTFKAMVHDISDVSATGAGRVVSVQSGSIVIDTASAASLTQTTTITAITDDAALNGSVTGAVLAGASTDDTTLVLTGTISGTLAVNQKVAVYDTVNGVTTEVAGTVTGVTVGSGTTWTFTPSVALTAAQAGTHSFTARVENTVSGAQASVSNAYAVKVFTAGLDVSVTDNAGALQGTADYAAGVSSDDTTPTLSGSLSSVGGLSTGDEVAVYQTLNGVTTFAGVASVTGSGASLAWSYTPSTALSVGDYTFKAMVQPAGDKMGLAGKVVATSQIVKVTATDITFDAITATTDTTVSTSSYKALSVASKMALDMNTYTHADFDVLNLQASATAKIDLADVMQGAKNLFTSAKFTTVSGAGLGDTTTLDQFLVNGNATNALTFAGPATTWTNSGVVSNSGHQYDVYTSGIAQLLIDKDVTNRTGFTVI